MTTQTFQQKRTELQALCGDKTNHKNCYLAGDWFWTCRSCGKKLNMGDV